MQPAQLDQLLHPQFDPKASYTVLAKGLNASPGAAVGKVYFTADDAEARHEPGEHVILVRPETSPDDLHGMIAAEGILTSRGGLVSATRRSSRAAWASPRCAAPRPSRSTSRDRASSHVDGTTVREGDVISINGTTGEVVVGAVPVITPEPTGHFETILGWADEFRAPWRCAPTPTCPDDAAAWPAEFGAEGIGLCRTEHMFLGDRLPIVQR